MTIVVLLCGLLVGQVVLPAAAVPPSANSAAVLDPPLVALAEMLVACMEVALVCVWVLLTSVERGVIFDSPSTVRYVDAVIAAVLAATMLLAAAGWYLSVAARPAAPALLISVATGATGGAGFGLLVTVMRGLLLQARQLRSELAGVV